MEEQKKHSWGIIIVIIIAVLVLAGLVYFYFASTATIYSVKKVPVAPTNVITFTAPEVLPAVQQNGECFSESISAPYRQDAWRCMIGNSIYDPCFETPQNGLVFCQENPLASDSVLIKITKPLPARTALANAQDNWAWFLTLEDGTYCSPFTGTRPFFSPDQVAYYGCHSDNKDQQIVLLGDLTKNNVWTASEVVLTQNGGSWAIKSTQQANIKTVWQ